MVNFQSAKMVSHVVNICVIKIRVVFQKVVRVMLVTLAIYVLDEP